MAQQSQPTKADLVNHRARLVEDYTYRTRDNKTHVLPKDREYIVVDRAPGRLWLRYPLVGDYYTTSNHSCDVPIDKVEVLAERYFTNANCAGRIVHPVADVVPQGENGFRFVKDRDGQILSMSEDQTQFIVTVPYGINVGETFILPVRYGKIRNNFPSDYAWAYIHHRFHFRMDYTCRDKNGNTTHVFLRNDNQCCVRAVSSDGRILTVTTPAADGGRQRLLVDFWAGTHNTDNLRTADFENRTFIARRDTNCTTRTSDVLKTNMIGYIQGLNSAKTTFHVRTFTGKEFCVPTVRTIEVGVPRGDYRIVQSSTSAARYGGPQPTLSAPIPQTGDLVDRLLTEVLTELYAQRHNTPETVRRYDVFMRDSNAIAATIATFKRGVHPKAFEAMNNARCISLDVIRSLPSATSSNDKGIYVRLYEGFPKDSPYRGKIFDYVGQTTVDFKTRGKSHASRAKKGTTGSRHYAVANAARTLNYRAIFRLEEDMPRDKVNLLECLFMMILNSFSPRIKVMPTEDQWKTKTTGPSFNYFANAHLATLLSQIMDKACKHTGFSYPTGGSLELEGLNLNLPLLEVSWNTKHRWVRQILDDRYIFSTSPYTYQNQGKSSESEQFTFWIASGNDETHAVLVKPDKRHGLDTGKKIWYNLEVMKQSSHEAPFYRLPKIGSLNNWNVGSRIGIKVTWEHNGKCYAKYIQQVSVTSKLDSAHIAHKQGAGLYAYIMQSHWPYSPDRPALYSKHPHIAEVLDLKVDHYRQECILDMRPPPTSFLPAVEKKLDAAANLMRNMGLENVNHTWQGLGYIDLDAEVTAKDTNMKTVKKWIGNRSDCDFCLTGRLVSYSQSGKTRLFLPNISQYETIRPHMKCEQAEDANGNLIDRCQPCVDRELPCSWSYVEKLFGSPKGAQQPTNHNLWPRIGWLLM
jgi:hypothetical protein